MSRGKAWAKFMDYFWTYPILSGDLSKLGGGVSLKNIHALAALPRGNFLMLCHQLKPSVLPSITLDTCIVALKAGIDG